MRRLLIVLVIVAAGAGGWWWWSHSPAANAAAEDPAASRRGGVGRANTVVPVLVSPATAKDVPIYLVGIGTVQASASVTVRSQIDGKLVAVNFKEGQDVKAGDLLAQIDPRSYQAALDLAKAKKAQDEANLANARIDLARYARLAANAYTSAQQADTQRATVAQDEALVAQDQAQIDTAMVNLSYSQIRAPIDGRIGLRLVDPGNIVHASDTTGLCVITTLQPISTVFTLPQQSLAAAARALARGHAEVIALPQDVDRPTSGGAVLDRGELLVIDNSVDSTTGTIKLKASFPNEKLSLWPGGFVNVRLRVETVKDAITIPPVAVQRGPQGAYVYVAKPDDTVERRAVKLGAQDAQNVIITSGLELGEKVITDGASRVVDGGKIRIAEPTPTPDAAARPKRQRPQN